MKDSKPHVFALAPTLHTDDETLHYYVDYSQALSELPRAFADLGLSWSWIPTTMDNYKSVIDSIKGSGLSKQIVFNMCDGDELNGVPGISVVKYLEESGLLYTGAREHFYDITASKIPMKRAFDQAQVSTPKWTQFRPESESAFRVLPPPLIVKPGISGGSMGISIKSVVHTIDELDAQIQTLHSGCHGWNTSDRGIFIERFVSGREFTSLIVGGSKRPSQATIFAPVERVFDASLPEFERFLSFDRVWEFYENEAPLPEQAPLYNYAAVNDAELAQRIKELSWQAYAAVGGTGYGRMDIRLDEKTGELFVLEVNAQCGLSEDENVTSIGAILRFANKSFSDLLMLIIQDAVREGVVAQ